MKLIPDAAVIDILDVEAGIEFGLREARSLGHVL